MNICMLLASSDFPPDLRVEKEARSLISAGHRVFLLCLRTGNNPPASVWNGVQIRRIAPPRLLARKFNALVYALFLRDLQWQRAIRELIAAEGIAAIHVHDLPMVGTALSAAGPNRIPVIADFHENYPALVRLGFSRRRPRLAERLTTPGRWERAETRRAMRCHHVFVVVNEAKERLAAKGIPPQKIAVVSNTPDIEDFLSLPIDAALVKQHKGGFVISYVGGFSPHRGLDTAIKAMPRILKEVPNARLLLVGDGEMMPELRTLTKTMGLHDKVVFTGWQDFSKIPSYIAASDVCIVPYVSSEQTEASAPHKLFQYMLMAKPIVASSCRSLRRFLEETGAGLVFQAGDSESLAETILKLKDPATRRRLGEAGRKAVLAKWNWKSSARNMLEVYDRLLQSSG